MKKTFTFLSALALAVGMQAQSYVMRIYQHDSNQPSTHLVASVDKMYFYEDGFSRDIEWPLDNFSTKTLTLSDDEMSEACARMGMSWDEMKAAIADGTVKMYARTEEGEVDYDTATDPAKGFIYSKYGNIVNEGNEQCASTCKVDASGSALAIDFALYDYEDDLANSPLLATDEIEARFALAKTDGSASFAVVVYCYVLDAGTIIWDPSYEAAGDFTYNVSLQPENSYKYVTIELDGEAMAAALGCDDVDALVASITGADSINVITVHGVNADGSYYEGTTAGAYGNWFNAEGSVCTWGSDNGAFVYIEAVSGEDPLTVHIGEMPNACTIGDKATIKQAYVNAANDKEVVITYNINIVGE